MLWLDHAHVDEVKRNSAEDQLAKFSIFFLQLGKNPISAKHFGTPNDLKGKQCNSMPSYSEVSPIYFNRIHFLVYGLWVVNSISP